MIRTALAVSLAFVTIAMPAALSQTQEQRTACAGDVQKLCANVDRANAGIPKCLAANKDKLSAACRKALKI